MLHFVVDLIDQRIPILDLPIALLVEVGRQRYVVKEHGVDVEGIVRTDERKDARGPMPGPTFVDGEAEGLLGLPLALLDVGLLPVEGRAGHGKAGQGREMAWCWLAAGPGRTGPENGVACGALPQD